MINLRKILIQITLDQAEMKLAQSLFENRKQKRLQLR